MLRGSSARSASCPADASRRGTHILVDRSVHQTRSPPRPMLVGGCRASRPTSSEEITSTSRPARSSSALTRSGTHWLGGRSFGPSEDQFEIVLCHDGDDRTVLLLDIEPELRDVERDGLFDIVDHVPNPCHAIVPFRFLCNEVRFC